MSKRNILKRMICSALSLIFILAIMAVNVSAEESTKVVTVVQEQTLVTDHFIVADIIGQYRNTTYSYDDGSYKGTLAFSQITGIQQLEQVPVPVPSGNRYYRYNYKITYTGTVNKYIKEYKDVTVTQSKSEVFAINTNINAVYSGSTYKYDDGTYSGTLTFSKITNVRQGEVVPVFSPSGTVYYRYTCDVTYTGTVTKYIF